MTAKAYAGKNRTGAKSIHPELDINRLIKIAFELCCKGSAISEDDLKRAYKEAMDEVKPYAERQIKKRAGAAVKAGIVALGIKELANEKFASALVNNAQQIGHWVHQYIKGEISDEAFVNNLVGPSTLKIITDILEALGIDEKLGVQNMQEVLMLSPPILAYNASMAAYKELRKAQEELAAAREERIRIEKACAESVAMILKYREEMDNVVTTYLTEHLETFEAGFAAMDQAMIDDDIDGYIKGNVAIQKILKYDVQFTSQEEFDDLMDSDFAFKL